MIAGIRRTRRVAALIGSLIGCYLLHLLWRAFRRPSPWPRRFLGLAARAVGARVRLYGAPVRHDVFYVANHVSWIDILAMGGATGCGFVAHDGVAKWPVIGALARLNNTLFVTRDRRHAVGEQIAALRAALADHQPMTLFPEGTTGNGVEMLPFKPSLLAVMLPPPREMMLQPVFIDYGAEAGEIAWTDGEGIGANALRLLGRQAPIEVTLHFLEPFRPADMPDRKMIAAEARARIAVRMAAFAPQPIAV